MIVWTPIAVNEKPALRGKVVLPEYSAAVIGSSVVLRAYGGGLSDLSLALTTAPSKHPMTPVPGSRQTKLIWLTRVSSRLRLRPTCQAMNDACRHQALIGVSSCPA
jgi:hypothetical protein